MLHIREIKKNPDKFYPLSVVSDITKIGENTLKTRIYLGRIPSEYVKDKNIKGSFVVELYNENKPAIKDWPLLREEARRLGRNYELLRKNAVKGLIRAKKDAVGRWRINPSDALSGKWVLYAEFLEITGLKNRRIMENRIYAKDVKNKLRTKLWVGRRYVHKTEIGKVKRERVKNFKRDEIAREKGLVLLNDVKHKIAKRTGIPVTTLDKLSCEKVYGRRYIEKSILDHPFFSQRLYKTKEMAEILGVRESTIKRWKHKGIIKTIRCDKIKKRMEYRTPESEVQRLLTNKLIYCLRKYGKQKYKEMEYAHELSFNVLKMLKGERRVKKETIEEFLNYFDRKKDSFNKYSLLASQRLWGCDDQILIPLRKLDKIMKHFEDYLSHNIESCDEMKKFARELFLVTREDMIKTRYKARLYSQI